MSKVIGNLAGKTAKWGKLCTCVHNFPHFKKLITSHLLRPRYWNFNGCIHCIIVFLCSKFGVNCTKFLDGESYVHCT